MHMVERHMLSLSSAWAVLAGSACKVTWPSPQQLCRWHSMVIGGTASLSSVCCRPQANLLWSLCPAGRIASGRVRVGDRIKVLQHEGGAVTDSSLKVTRIEKRAGLGKVQLQAAVAGDVVSLAGAGDAAGIADTIAAPAVEQALDPGPIDPPTLRFVVCVCSSGCAWLPSMAWAGPAPVTSLTCQDPSYACACLAAHSAHVCAVASDAGEVAAVETACPCVCCTNPVCRSSSCSMVFSANDSPLAGRAGKAVTGRAIGARLMQEAESSVSLRVTPLPGGTEKYEVQVRVMGSGLGYSTYYHGGIVVVAQRCGLQAFACCPLF